ncbi:MAG TPA: Mur ligase domain-containing protein, partial [Chitinophagaceae bacterium]|nr:Mur ligase domain-containing protein [Chitinophagaceae bacterium]
MIWNNVHRIYFIGIGGIGMSALARYFNQSGKVVSGYDKTRTPLCDQLLSEGIQIHFNEDLDALDPKADLVVYTPAIPASHAEWLWYQQHGYTILKRSEVLQKISENMKAICVAGTHGKTTVSTCISHILRHSQYGCHAFLGGISA